jgi:hypothetical protein
MMAGALATNLDPGTNIAAGSFVIMGPPSQRWTACLLILLVREVIYLFVRGTNACLKSLLF